MLREAKNKKRAPRLIAYKFTNTGSITNSIGVGDVTQSRGGTGDTTTTFIEPFRRVGVSFACGDTATGANGGYVSGVTTSSTVGFQSRDAGGTANDASAFVVSLGWASPDTSIVVPQLVKSSWIDPRYEVFKINTAGSGTILIGTRLARLTRNGTGDVTLTFLNSFRNNNVVAVANPNQATIIQARVDSATAAAVRIKLFNTSSAAVDGIFNLLVVGSDSKETTYGRERPLQSSQRKPYIVGYRVAAAAASLTVGSEDGSVVRNSTGDYTITFANTQFAREPICFCMASVVSANGRGQIASQSATSVNVKLSNQAGTAADSAAEVLVFGFQDASEY